MILRTLARQLVARFSGKLGYPRTKKGLTDMEIEAGLKALIDAFEQAPENATQAATVADDLQVDTRYCPDVSEVWRAARALKDQKQIGCPDCDDGWVQVPEKAKPGYPPPVRRCHCRRKAAT